jgi:transcriptional regulator with XRE-family HTH domain
MTQGDERENGDTLLAQQLAAVGGKVHDVRESHGWSRQGLADRTGIGRPSLSLIEAGKQNITLDTLWRLAEALDVHWADLLDDRKTILPRRRRRSTPFDQQLVAFGRKLYQARVLQDLYQQTLTDRTRIGRTAISEMEDGKRNITLSTLSRLACALDVHWADLLDDRKQNPPQPAR